MKNPHSIIKWLQIPNNPEKDPPNSILEDLLNAGNVFMIAGWCGMQKDFYPFLLDMLPSLREYGNVSYQLDASSAPQSAPSRTDHLDHFKRIKRNLRNDSRAVVPMLTIDAPDWFIHPEIPCDSFSRFATTPCKRDAKILGRFLANSSGTPEDSFWIEAVSAARRITPSPWCLYSLLICDQIYNIFGILWDFFLQHSVAIFGYLEGKKWILSFYDPGKLQRGIGIRKKVVQYRNRLSGLLCYTQPMLLFALIFNLENQVFIKL